VAKFTEEDDALLEELGVEIEAKKESSRTPREERIIAGFEEIQRFVEQHGRTPQHGEDRDIFERLCAVRLDRLRELDDCRAVLEPLDHQGLLTGAKSVTVRVEEIDDDELLAQLGVKDAAPADIAELRHVRSAADKRTAEEIANRQKCEDFEQFEPPFEQVQKELRAFDEKVESMMVDSQDGANQIQGPHWHREASHEWGSLIPTICANVSLRQSKPVIPARKLPSCTTWL